MLVDILQSLYLLIYEDKQLYAVLLLDKETLASQALVLWSAFKRINPDDIVAFAFLSWTLWHFRL